MLGEEYDAPEIEEMVATTVTTLVSTGLLEGPDAFLTGFNAETDYDTPGAAKDRLFPKVPEVDPLQRLYEPDGLAARWSESDDRAFMEGFSYLENGGKPDTIHLDEIPFGKSVGAKAKNYIIKDLATGEMFEFAEGTRLQDVEVFAGKGVRTEYRNAYKYSEKYGGNTQDWQHVKGFGWVSTPEGDRRAEVHWSQCKDIGKVEFFVKRWLDE